MHKTYFTCRSISSLLRCPHEVRLTPVSDQIADVAASRFGAGSKRDATAIGRLGHASRSIPILSWSYGNTHGNAMGTSSRILNENKKMARHSLSGFKAP